MSEETEALHEQEAAYIYRLAEDLEIDYCGDVVAHNAAAELRRLSIENEALGLHLSERMKDLARVEAQRDALLEALKALLSDYDSAIDPGESKLIDKARAAIKAVEGENHAKNL